MENKQREEGRNDAEKARMLGGVLEDKLYSQVERYFVHDKLKYGGENGR